LEVVYKKWNDEEGLEEIQAEIYTEASGLPANAWQIKARNIQRGEDSTRYALTEDGKPLAYVTSDIDFEDREALIGYPWKMPDCSPEVQEKIFNEQLEYLENLEDVDAIMTAVVLDSKISEKQLEWFESRGFKPEDSVYQYSANVDVEKAANMKVEGKAADYYSIVATMDDIDILVELCMSDENLNQAFPDEDGFRQYFEDRVFEVKSPIILFDGEKPVAASAPLKLQPDGGIVRGKEERIVMRFQAIRAGYAHAWYKLFVEFAKYCKEIGWTDLQIQAAFGFTSSDPQPSGMAKMLPQLEEYEIRLFKRE
jgi:predicted nuclease of predicted toxin-antitoxin system